MTLWSTYARLLKPGQKFWTKDDYKTYVVERLEISVRPEIYMVRVFVENRKNPLVFDETDRVNLEPPDQPTRLAR